MWKEFREFATRGNVFDMAIGIIIGSAFGKIVSSLVADVLMPPIGMILGKVDFAGFYLNLSGGSYETLAKAKKAGAVTLNYGLFLNTVVDFLIVAFVIFLMVKQVNRLKRAPAAASVRTKDCPQCCSTIPLKAVRCPHCTSSLGA